MKQLIAIDTETCLLGPGSVAPKLICMSAATFDVAKGEICAALYGNAQMEEIRRVLVAMLTDPEIQLVFHNAPFDLTVIAAAMPSLMPLIFEKLAQGGVTDTLVREKLLNLSTHGNLKNYLAPDGSKHRITYTLADLVMNYTGVDRSADKSGDDIWRMNYEMLDGMHRSEYPEAAATYAMQDATDTLEVHDLQAERILGEKGPGSVRTAEFQAAVAFCLRLMTCWGLTTDPERVEEIDAMLRKELTPEKLNLLIESNVLELALPERPYKNGAKDADGNLKMRKATKDKISKVHLKSIVTSLCEKLELPIKLTKTGAVSTDVEVIEKLAPHSPLIKQYQHRQKLQKLVSTYLPHIRGASTVHPEFDVLKATGRTSSFASKNYPSSNIQQEDPRTRPCFKARPGKVFVASDYNAIELCSLGQTCHELFGFSVHRDKINEGVDLHAYLGAQLAVNMDEDFGEVCKTGALFSPTEVYEAFIAQKESNPEFYAHWRKFAKPVGLGYPGGMGVDTFINTARNSYGVIVDRDMAQQMKDIWLETYPEMIPYFQWIKTQCIDPNNYSTDEETGKQSALYCYSSPMGMYRAGATYCAAANGAALQTRTAEGAKGGVFEIARACYDWTQGSILFGCRPVIFMHDEIIVEIPDDEKKHERALEMSNIMISAMRRVIPDVEITTETALMVWWNKKAEPVFDEQGRLQVWQPKPVEVETV
jgi:DNA polymerase I-like protein with 3'-5' exonuclease and polymerase domains